jgi:hypothetical protein
MDQPILSTGDGGHGWVAGLALALAIGTGAALFDARCPVAEPEPPAPDAAWEMHCVEHLAAVRRAIAEGALGEPMEGVVGTFDGPAGPTVMLRIGDHRFVAGASATPQPDIADRDWYDLNHGFAAAADTLPSSVNEPSMSLFKDEFGRSAFLASLGDSGPHRARFVALAQPALDACLTGAHTP